MGSCRVCGGHQICVCSCFEVRHRSYLGWSGGYRSSPRGRLLQLFRRKANYSANWEASSSSPSPPKSPAAPLTAIPTRLQRPYIAPHFATSVVHALLELDTETGRACPVARDLQTGQWRSAREVPFRAPELMVATQLRLVREVTRTFLHVVRLDGILCNYVDGTFLGVSMRMGGVCFGVNPIKLGEARNLVCNFAAAKPIRASADLASPIRAEEKCRTAASLNQQTDGPLCARCTVLAVHECLQA